MADGEIGTRHQETRAISSEASMPNKIPAIPPVTLCRTHIDHPFKPICLWSRVFCKLIEDFTIDDRHVATIPIIDNAARHQSAKTSTHSCK